MVDPTRTTEDLTYERDWIAELQVLIDTTGEREMYVKWRWRHGNLLAIVYPPRIDGHRIGILLPPQEALGFLGGEITISLPEEEECVYQKISGGPGQTCLTLQYPHCDAHPRQYFEISRFAIATTPELLDDAMSETLVQ